MIDNTILKSSKKPRRDTLRISIIRLLRNFPQTALIKLNSTAHIKSTVYAVFMTTFENTLTQFKRMLEDFGISCPDGDRNIEFYSMFFPPEKVAQIPLTECQKHY